MQHFQPVKAIDQNLDYTKLTGHPGQEEVEVLRSQAVSVGVKALQQVSRSAQCKMVTAAASEEIEKCVLSILLKS